MRLLLILILCLNGFAWGQELNNPNYLSICKGNYNFTNYLYKTSISGWHHCWGKIIDTAQYIYEGEWSSGRPYGIGTYSFGDNKYTGEITEINVKGVSGIIRHISQNEIIYVGEMKDGNRHGKGIFTLGKGQTYTGYWINDKPHGLGKLTFSDGRNPEEGHFENGSFVKFMKVDLSDVLNVVSKFDNEIKVNETSQRASEKKYNADDFKENSRAEIERERQKLAEERRKFDEEKRNREQVRNAQRLSLRVNNTQPDAEGDFTINIQTNADTASLKINGEEQGGRADGNYVIKKVARAGQNTQFIINAKDINGNVDSKTITVTRQIVTSNLLKYAELNPALVKSQTNKDAVAIIIGIQNYKRVPKAEFANNDAQAFYDYAIRALGVKQENIKLLVDEQADEVEILSAFQNWLPVKVRKQKTDVYVYYSGHGLPSDDGNSLYILPHGADKQFIAKTAINQQEVVAALQAAQPKSVTMFMDACYSGQIRTGENLIASARPIAVKSNAQLFPAEFTVITASQSDQIASSSADFKHGIFSYYLMKGMEGDADENKDNKITVGEMQSYLQDMVGRKAMSVNRKQSPQLTGDVTRVLVGR